MVLHGAYVSFYVVGLLTHLSSLHMFKLIIAFNLVSNKFKVNFFDGLLLPLIDIIFLYVLSKGVFGIHLGKPIYFLINK